MGQRLILVKKAILEQTLNPCVLLSMNVYIHIFVILSSFLCAYIEKQLNINSSTVLLFQHLNLNTKIFTNFWDSVIERFVSMYEWSWSPLISESLGTLGSPKEPPGAIWSPLKHVELLEPMGASWNSLKPPGTLWSPLEVTGIHWTTSKLHLIIFL